MYFSFDELLCHVDIYKTSATTGSFWNVIEAVIFVQYWCFNLIHSS